ncbi:MAG: PEP-CTERM sorting domain-containing protein [Terriglobia bacterium]
MPSPCASGTLNTYVGLGVAGCTEGNLLFSDFTFGASAAGAGAILPVDSGISVTPESSGNNVGFIFDAALSPGSNQSQDVTIDYVVRVLSGGNNITDSALSVEASGNASANMTECLGGLLPACSGGTAVGLMANANQLAVSNTFGAVSTVGAGLDISATNGGSISGEQTQFSTGTDDNFVPEPASLMLFGTGALGLALLLRKKLRLPV